MFPFTGGQDGPICRWDLRYPSGHGPVCEYEGSTAEYSVYSLATDPGQRALLSGGACGNINCWDLEGGMLNSYVILISCGVPILHLISPRWLEQM